MQSKRKYFDKAVGESEGNGGDVQLFGNDLAVVYGYENQVYLALFGGNVEGNTQQINPPGTQRLDWWGNTLFFGNDAARQYNSNTERTLNTTALNSAGRIKIESAVKQDLKYLNSLGAVVTVNAFILGVNVFKINIEVIYPNGSKSIATITFKRQQGTGDFSIFDFNEDFFT